MSSQPPVGDHLAIPQNGIPFVNERPMSRIPYSLLYFHILHEKLTTFVFSHTIKSYMTYTTIHCAQSGTVRVRYGLILIITVTGRDIGQLSILCRLHIEQHILHTLHRLQCKNTLVDHLLYMPLL